MNRLQDKIAIVTGAGRGIGRSIAELFAAQGATVIATSQHPHSDFAPGIEFHQQDVADAAGWDTLVAGVIDRHGRVDVLVNNAGIIAYETLDVLTMEDWNRVIAVNQTGVWLGMRAVMPSMLAHGNGSIINVSSIWGNAAVAGAHAYHATKGAVRNMSKNAAITYATQGVRVNSIHPGFIATPLTDAQAPEVNEFVVGMTPMGRAGRPEEIAHGAVFLASDESSFVTGAELVIDGGYLAQ
ncbi:SDR family oxidoreductase [Leifsonia sp. H3M29-4]|uniref:SDR family NAD(P)-dependent oxidoreductase n=1 Tax=Salinibacterium metalliresistens TaxID=3031321 RepID=UPI0023DCE9B1|nr:SDR family oxidoreductase [Salinibacterium metalliresistens]MDF1478311.1 SDR family oxidoreductase [Salinibacterium metalliresistens]